MSILIFSGILIPTLLSGHPLPYETSVEAYQLRGSVHSVRVEEAKISIESGKRIEKARRLVEGLIFGPNGKVNRQEIYSLQPELDLQRFFAYDRSSKLIELKVIYPKTTSANSRIVYVYSNGTLSEAAEYDYKGILKGKVVFTLTAGGKTSEEISFLPDGSMKFRVVYAYNNEGKLTEESTFGPDNKVQLKKTYRYTTDGNLTTIEQYGSNGLANSKSELVYDGKNLVRRVNYGPQSCIDSFFYDEKGNVIEESHSCAKRLKDRKVYEYQFDLSGNWIQRATFICSEPSGRSSCQQELLIYRTINYYDSN